jgi:pyridinium-3,5-biscarboxylic acid mononucleotide synthase
VSPDKLRDLLEDVRAGRVDVAAAMAELRDLPYENLGYARLDHHRALRTGSAEVVFGKGKPPSQLAEIMRRLACKNGRSLATKVPPEVAAAVSRELPEAHYSEDCGALVLGDMPEPRTAWRVAVLSAGTADLPIAREAELTAQYLACNVQTYFDVGVAGLHRTLDACQRMEGVRAAVVVAGMDGALPSVLGGLLPCPVIAVPTSIGYGASFEGLAALLTMLNCCAPGVAVVNIDNGFGAGYLAHQIASAGENA